MIPRVTQRKKASLVSSHEMYWFRQQRWWLPASLKRPQNPILNHLLPLPLLLRKGKKASLVSPNSTGIWSRNVTNSATRRWVFEKASGSHPPSSPSPALVVWGVEIGIASFPSLERSMLGPEVQEGKEDVKKAKKKKKWKYVVKCNRKEGIFSLPECHSGLVRKCIEFGYKKMIPSSIISFTCPCWLVAICFLGVTLGIIWFEPFLLGFLKVSENWQKPRRNSSNQMIPRVT